MAEDPGFTRLRQERDLYLGLLNLNGREDPGPFLEEALRLIVGVLGADQGYLEVSDMNEGPTWWRAAGCSEGQVERIKTFVSRGIIQQALVQGRPLAIPSAFLDPHFGELPSVQANQIESVLCVPIVAQIPIGVLYVTGRRGGGSFSSEEVERASAFARHLSPLVEALFFRSRERTTDHVAPFRKKLKLDDVVGGSEALAKVLRQVEVMASLDIPVLIGGETGTGKSQLARLIHDNGRRRNRRFVALNCSAIPENLFESELFGAIPGAFTGAVRRIEGKVAAAEHGTLFLDEVTNLSWSSQSKLLQFLDSKKYFPLGSSEELTAGVRVIAAANKDFEEEVRAQRFREDLFFRLQVLSIRMPSLSERRQDIRPLAKHFAAQAQLRHDLPARELSTEAPRAIEAFEWKGNVRELANKVERGAVNAEGDHAERIETRHVFDDVSARGSSNPLTFHGETRRFQASLVLRTLEATEWNVTAAARALDITRAHTYNLIRTFDLSRKSKAHST